MSGQNATAGDAGAYEIVPGVDQACPLQRDVGDSELGVGRDAVRANFEALGFVRDGFVLLAGKADRLPVGDDVVDEAEKSLVVWDVRVDWLEIDEPEVDNRVSA